MGGVAPEPCQVPGSGSSSWVGAGGAMLLGRRGSERAEQALQAAVCLKSRQRRAQEAVRQVPISSGRTAHGPW